MFGAGSRDRLSAEDEVGGEERLTEDEVVAKWLADVRPGPDLSAPLDDPKDLLARARGEQAAALG
jgi:glutathione S-transferase